MAEYDVKEMQRYARIAGIGYLVIIVSGIYAEFFVRGSLVVPGDPAATAASIRGAEVLFRSSLVSEFLMLFADVVVALALWIVFRPVSRGLALLAAFFRLVHAAVVGANMMNVWIPVVLLGGVAAPSEGGARAAGALGDGVREALALVYLEVHGWGYAAGLVFFAGACAALGYLVLRSRYVPGVLGVMLLIAAVGYLVDGLARTLLPDYAAYETTFGLMVLLPAFVAEVSFTVWLLAKGVDPEAVAARRVGA